MRTTIIATFILFLAIAIALPVMADDTASVTVNAPDTVVVDTSFYVHIDITEVADLNSIQYDICFDPAMLRLENITAGQIGTHSPESLYNQLEAGRYRVVQWMGTSTVTGSGCLAILQFKAIGTSEAGSEISFTGGVASRLTDGVVKVIQITWTSGYIQVTPGSGSTTTTTTTTSPPTTTTTTSPTTTTTNTPAGGGGNIGGGGGGGAAGVLGLSNILDANGKLLVETRAISVGAEAYLLLPAGTVCSTYYGGTLSMISIQLLASNQSPAPETPNVFTAGNLFELGPEFAVFDPPIKLIFNYDPDNLPEGITENDLYIATWDEENNTWLKLESTVEPDKGIVWTEISHFSIYTIITNTGKAEFEFSNLNIMPSEIETNEKVSVSVTVTNTGDLSGSCEVVLNIDGQPVESRDITLDGGSSESVLFSFTPETEGFYTMNIGPLSATLDVFSPAPVETTTVTTSNIPVSTTSTSIPPQPASFTVSQLAITPDAVGPSEEVTISARVTNNGGTAGSYNVVLMVNGAEESRQQVALDAGSDIIVTFKVSREQAGGYTASLGDMSILFTVTGAAQPELSEPVGGLDEPPQTSSRWMYIGITAAAVVIIGLLVFFLLKRKYIV